MLKTIRAYFGNKPSPLPRVPFGERVYAVGDVHGRADLFDAMIKAIERDDATRGPARTTIVLLGDLVDRGPASAAVIATARGWQSHRDVRILCGNHEQVLLESVTDLEAFSHFMEFGGRETILSYGVDDQTLTGASLVTAQQMMLSAIPAADLEFVAGFEDYVIIGDYLFVHAGIYPGKSLAAQHPRHLRWIREPFLSHRGNHGHYVVHGHTIKPVPDVRHNRLGLDTGAYLTGRLAAVGLQDGSQWLLGVEDTPSGVRSATAPVRRTPS